MVSLSVVGFDSEVWFRFRFRCRFARIHSCFFHMSGGAKNEGWKERKGRKRGEREQGGMGVGVCVLKYPLTVDPLHELFQSEHHAL